jgi:uncharacterized alkaline shock family protein YloU
VISPDVLARYAADAAGEVPGVRPRKRRGARFRGAEVGVHVTLDYGVNVPEAAAEVQRRVADYLERMTDVRPETVHVVVDGIRRG